MPTQLYIWLPANNVPHQDFTPGTLVLVKDFSDDPHNELSRTHSIPFSPEFAELPSNYLDLLEEEGQALVSLKLWVRVYNIQGLEYDDGHSWCPSTTFPKFGEEIRFRSYGYKVLKTTPVPYEVLERVMTS